MGLTSAKVTISGAKTSEQLELLVDTGSIYTWVSRDTLSRIGPRPLGRRSFRTIEGGEIVRDVGEATVELAGERATRIVVYAEPSDVQVLGVDSLEGLGLEVDPTTRRLKKVEAFAAY